MDRKSPSHTGLELARMLAAYASRSDVTVIAVTPGSVPVALASARALRVAADYYGVSPILAPETTIQVGAVASGGAIVLDERVIAAHDIPTPVVQRVSLSARLALSRSRLASRAAAVAANAAGRVLVIVDEVLATPLACEAAMLALQAFHPARVVVASPLGSRETVDRLRGLADEVVCPKIVDDLAIAAGNQRSSSSADEGDVERLLSQFDHRSSPGAHFRQAAADPIDAIRDRAVRLRGEPSDFDLLLDGIGDARIVLLGEATHGTHEFYRMRALITRRLIEERGFAAVAVEADWPDAYRVNKYVRAQGPDAEAVEALQDFTRFPTWMWRNADVLDFVGWLRTHNDAKREANRAGFYGLDLYSLHASMNAVLLYLRKVDPVAADRARARYACFDRFGRQPQDYAYATAYGLSASCEQEVVNQLVELHRRRGDYAGRNGRVAPDDYFYAAQNARLVKSAEEYYRTMMRGHVASWNLRDRHMVETLSELQIFLEQNRPGAKLVVWAHNSHLGDARATEMSEHGELNVGQLVRERVGLHDAVLVGFTTSTGTVTAASEWDAPPDRKRLRPPIAGSYERMFHQTRIPKFLLPIRTDPRLAGALSGRHLERAVGVLYLPATERASHYFRATLAQQFDYVFHIDETRAVEPLERGPLWEAEEMADTFPSGL
jgi:erythromycin esterase-like protein/predicted phosphoribosyltransferase